MHIFHWSQQVNRGYERATCRKSTGISSWKGLQIFYPHSTCLNPIPWQYLLLHNYITISYVESDLLNKWVLENGRLLFTCTELDWYREFCLLRLFEQIRQHSWENYHRNSKLCSCKGLRIFNDSPFLEPLNILPLIHQTSDLEWVFHFYFLDGVRIFTPSELPFILNLICQQLSVESTKYCSQHWEVCILIIEMQILLYTQTQLRL